MAKQSERYPIRITHLITTLEAGGAENMLFKLVCESSKNRRFKHQVISLTGKGRFGELLQERGIPTDWLKMRGQPGDLNSLFKLFSLLKTFKPHLLQTWLYHSDIIGLIMGKLAKIRYQISNVRCSDMKLGQYAWTTRLVFNLLRHLSRYPDAICANSQAGISYHLQQGFRPKQWVLIPNGFDTEYYKPCAGANSKLKTELGISDSGMIIGMVARYDVMKDFGNLIQAARIIVDHLNNVYFVLIGKEVNKENIHLMQQIHGLKMENNFFLMDQRFNLEEWYPAMDLFALSSWYGEGFPNVIGEAMACGVPCVSTDVGDARKIIGKTGRVVPAKNPDQFAMACLELLTLSSAERSKMGVSARQRVIDRYALPLIHKRYEALYDSVVQSK